MICDYSTTRQNNGQPMGAHGLGWAAQVFLLLGMGGLGILKSWSSWVGLGRAGEASEGHGLGGHGQPFLMGHNALNVHT